jgi:predicted PurR-regulated permease PerM
VGTSIILLVFGVDLVLFNGLMACILNYIPNIGSVLGVLLPLPFVLFKEEFALWELLAVAVALTVMQVQHRTHTHTPHTHTLASQRIGFF